MVSKKSKSIVSSNFIQKFDIKPPWNKKVLGNFLEETEKVGQKSESSLWHSGNHCFYQRREVWNKGIIVQIYCSNFHAWHKTFVEIKRSYITVEYIISINHNKKTESCRKL